MPTFTESEQRIILDALGSDTIPDDLLTIIGALNTKIRAWESRKASMVLNHSRPQSFVIQANNALRELRRVRRKVEASAEESSR